MLLKGIRDEIIEICHLLVKRKLVNLTAGNVSCKDKDSGLVAVTPSGMDYLKLRPRDIVVMDPKGNIVEGEKKPSIETPMHLAVYEARPDVGAVVHTHSTYATALGCLYENLPVITLEIASHIGSEIPVCRYAMPATKELAESVAEQLKNYNATLMPNHGVCVVGKNLHEAFVNAYSVEISAQIYYIAKTIGQPKVIPEKDVKEIHNFAATKYGQK